MAECSKVPVIKHYKGVCHVYVDADADLNMAEQIAVQRQGASVPAVCNAMETLLVDRAVAPSSPGIGRAPSTRTSNCARTRPRGILAAGGSSRKCRSNPPPNRIVSLNTTITS